MNKQQEFWLFYGTLVVVGLILSGCLYVMVEKIECFENPCSQCMNEGYICTDPNRMVDMSNKLNMEWLNGTT
jgi:hypothetical protein